MILHARTLIHVHYTNFQLLGEKIYSIRALSKERASYSVFSWIDKLNRLLVIINLLESYYRAKELFSLCSHSIVRIHNHCRLKESSQTLLVSVLVSTDDNLSAHIDRILTDLLELLNVIQYSHGTYVGVLVHWISHFQLFKDFLWEGIDEFIRNFLVDKDSLNRIAWLASVVIGPFDQGLQSQVKITVRCNICAIFATQIKLDINEVIFSHILVYVSRIFQGSHKDNIIDFMSFKQLFHTHGVCEESQS